MKANSLVLEIESASVRYGAQTALREASLTLRRGAITAVLGPNGAGKSSLVKAICGRAPVVNGAIRINGVDASAPSARAALGVAPQRAALYDALTAKENLYCFAQMAGCERKKAHARADEVLSLIGLKDAADARAGVMSGGMRQRINIGAAIVHHPALVILDEPTASLDPQGMKDVDVLISRLRDEDFGVLLVTHELRQAEELADEILILRDGEVKAKGSPQSLIDEHCGTALSLALCASLDLDLSERGFDRDQSRRGRWVRRFDDRPTAIKTLQSITQDGIAFDSIAITACTMADAYAKIVAKKAAPDL